MANLPSGYLVNLQQCRYSENTIKIYIQYFRNFTNFFQDKSLYPLTKEEINNYLLTLIRERKISSGQQNQRINAIKFYYEKVLGRNKEYYQIERPRKERKLPDVLSKKYLNKNSSTWASHPYRAINPTYIVEITQIGWVSQTLGAITSFTVQIGCLYLNLNKN